jgi:phosphatidylglycerol---prolipoprotein diacylglyceryl transferase
MEGRLRIRGDMQVVLPFPDIDPVLFSISLFGLELAIRWYALAYIAGLVLGWRYVAWLNRRPALWGGSAPLRPEAVEDLLTWMVLGVIVGGRLGFVLFYQPAHYLANPAEILAVWRGGMSFHGGFLGVVVALIAFGWRHGASPVQVGDAVAAAAPIGIFFGRLANFINAELWGRPSDVPWAVVFPGAGADCPADWIGVCARHPSQLYEAGLEGLVLGLVILWAILRLGWLIYPGRVIGLFLAGYGAARMFVERFREADLQFVTPDNPFGFVVRLGDAGLSMGQLLSLPMLLAGLALIFWSRRRA